MAQLPSFNAQLTKTICTDTTSLNTTNSVNVDKITGPSFSSNSDVFVNANFTQKNSISIYGGNATASSTSNTKATTSTVSNRTSTSTLSGPSLLNQEA